MCLLRRLDPRLLLLLMAAALALRVAVPAGFMPVADEQGLRVEICTGSGPLTVEIDPGSKDRQEQRDPCPYGLAAGPALLLPPLPALPAAPLALTPPPYPGLAAARLAAWRALRPPARGPPAIA